MKKQIFIMTLAGIMTCMLSGCGQSNTSEEKTNIASQDAGTVVADSTDNTAAVEQDTDDDNDMNTKNMISVEDLEVGKYKVTNEGRAVVVTHNDGTCIMTKTYNYKNDVIQNIDVVYKYADADKAKAAYEALMSEKSTNEKYSDVKLMENKIVMKKTQSKVDKLKSLTQKQLYEKKCADYENVDNTKSD